MAARSLQELEHELLEHVASCAKDPLLFVLTMFPWGQGELEGFDGPDAWQCDVLGKVRDGLLTPNQALQVAVASGHGVGKSALVAWLVYWAMSTMADTKGIVTANTETQLKTKTWAELAKWHRLAVNNHWFTLTATALFSNDPDHEKTWRIDQIAWSETRSEAFAGLHNLGKRVLLVFDEASAIPDVIWEVAEGALTDVDTEIMWFAFGNPTRSRGRFSECFGRFKHRWLTYRVDSRTAKMSNKTQIQKWIEDWGIESDFVKVRVLGQQPSADVNALFSLEDLNAAVARQYAQADVEGAEKVIGVDVARQGQDDSVIAFRWGRVMFPVKRMHVPDVTLVAQAVAIEQGLRADDATFVDATGGYGVGVVDTLRRLNHSCIEIYFNGAAADPRYFNKRSEMYFLFAKWVKGGGSLPIDSALIEELQATTYTYQGDKFRIVDKEDIREELGRSPDAGDAAALTFAAPVMPAAFQPAGVGVSTSRNVDSGDYDPFKEL